MSAFEIFPLCSVLHDKVDSELVGSSQKISHKIILIADMKSAIRPAHQVGVENTITVYCV